MTCPKCGAYCSDDCAFCPSCGAPLNAAAEAAARGGRRKKPIYKRVWFWLLVLLVVVNVSNRISYDRNIDKLPKNTSSPQQTTQQMSSGTPQQYDVPVGHRNALSRARSYLTTVGGLSYNRLIDQLKFEGYNDEECAFAVNNCGADWFEQALISAKSYLSNMAFSAQGLKDQLVYEQFTGEQANYAVENCGADWDEEAAEKAASYLSHMSFSSDQLIEQLEYEGFTPDQAVYGVRQNGY